MEFQFIRESISKGEHRRWRAERGERSGGKSHYNTYLCINMSVSQCPPKKMVFPKKKIRVLRLRLFQLFLLPACKLVHPEELHLSARSSKVLVHSSFYYDFLSNMAFELTLLPHLVESARTAHDRWVV
jgi:hypothetical protein